MMPHAAPRRHPLQTLGVAVLLAAASGCTAGQAGAQEDPPRPRPNIYEVSPEHLAALMAAADTSPGTLQVSGTARVRIPADRARISFAVETEAGSAREASSGNAQRMDAVIRALRGAGVQGLEIETHGYNLHPRYANPPRNQQGTREIAGYTAVNHVSVRVPDVEAVGRLIDAAVDAGANRVASLDFQAGDTEEARLEALRQAVAKARSEAQTIARAMGVTLGRPLEVQGGAQDGGPIRNMEMMAMRAEASTPVEPGSQTVTANVTITYLLGAGGR